MVKSIEWNNGGFRKRLSDYRRESNSARKHSSGQLIYSHRHELQIEILITGEDDDVPIMPGYELLILKLCIAGIFH